MQFTAVTILAAASAAFAAPLQARQDGPGQETPYTWSITQFSRQCAQDQSFCNYSFTINENNNQGTYDCKVTVPSANGAPASQSTSPDNFCGVYQINSNWATSPVDGKGFTNFAFRHAQYITYDSYKDSELESGNVVDPAHGNLKVYIK